MKAMKAMKKKAAMKRRAMKAAAEAPAPMKRMKAMKVMKKKKAMKAMAAMKAMKAMKAMAAMKAMKVMKKKNAMGAMKAMAAMKAMKAMRKKAAMKRRAMKAAAPAAMKAMKAMRKKAAMKRLVLDLGFDVLDGISWLNIEGDGLSSQGLDEDLHTTSESQHKMESGLLLDVVIGEGSAVFELLTSEDESLLIWWNTFLVLDFGFHIFNGVCWLDIEGDGLTSESLDEDLHTTSKSENEMESGLLLDVVVRESSAILELLTSKDESLLVWWDT